MISQRFSIMRQYEIKCKAFLPENEIKNIIIGVHGYAGDKESSMLKKLANSVCQRNTALICFDFPAHGKSPANEDMLTVENCKADLCAVMEYAKTNYPDAIKSVFATSYGGFITLLCADKLNAYKFVLRAPAVTMPEVLLKNVLQTTKEEFKKLNVIESGFERKIKLPYSFYEELTAQENLFTKKFDLPIQIIHGDCDNIVPYSDILAFTSSQKDISLQVIKGADHRFKNAGELEKIIELTQEFIGI